jgi:hypothetical protein
MPRKRTSADPVREVRIEALKFLTIAEDDPIWGKLEGVLHTAPDVAFVRIRPPLDVTDASINALKRLFPNARVRVLPRIKPQVVPAQAQIKASTLGIRETVRLMVQEANTSDREALSVLVEKTLVEVGL